MPKLRGALRKSFLERNQRVIGLVAIVLLVGGSAMALLLTGGVFASRYNVTAYFSDAAGIRPGDQVTVAGLPAGVVKGLEVQHGQVAVDLGINSGVDMPEDSTADIVVQTLLGKEAVDLKAGESKRLLEDGDTIPVQRTTTPVNITQLNDISVRLMNHSDAEALNRLLDEVSQVAAGKGPDVHRLVTGLADLAAAVDARRQQLGGLIDALRKLSTTLANKDQTIVSLIDNLTPVMQNLAQRQRAIATLLESTDSAAHETADLVRRNRGKLDATLNALHDDLAVIDRHQIDLAATIQYLNQAVQGYSSVGYSSGVPNRWANIFVASLGPAGVDALLGQCGAVDQLIDQILGSNCQDSGQGPGSKHGGPKLPPVPAPTLPAGPGPLPTGAVPVPTPTLTVPAGGGPLPTASISLPGLGKRSSAKTSALRRDPALPMSYQEFMQNLLSSGGRAP
jgi:phospholipid/cholesterol/gamma-HCH transport system substrate-binding protein